MRKPSPDTVPTIYTIPEVAEHLKVSPKTVRRWIAAGGLAAHRFGRQIRITGIDLVSFIAERKK